MYSVVEKHFEKRLRNISAIGKKFSEKFLCQGLNGFWIPVINVSRCKAEGEDLPFIITHKIQFEAQPIVLFPLFAISLKTLWLNIRLLWQTGAIQIVASTKQRSSVAF
jgi:hypothetical protein